MRDGAGNDHWAQVADRWRHVGPPLKPNPQELEQYRTWSCETPADVLILGVTQELYRLPWPSGTTLTAIDHSPQMVAQVWLGQPEDAICADWRAMPLPDCSKDVAITDGGLSMLNRQGLQQVKEELVRVLNPNGSFVCRLYLPPAEREDPDRVLRDLATGKIPNLSRLKLRLGMAMQEDPDEGIELDRIWTRLNRFAPDLDNLAGRIGWPPDHLKAIETYRGSTNSYHFYPDNEIRDLFQEFEVLEDPESERLEPSAKVVCFLLT